MFWSGFNPWTRFNCLEIVNNAASCDHLTIIRSVSFHHVVLPVHTGSLNSTGNGRRKSWLRIIALTWLTCLLRPSLIERHGKACSWAVTKSFWECHLLLYLYIRNQVLWKQQLKRWMNTTVCWTVHLNIFL